MRPPQKASDDNIVHRRPTIQPRRRSAQILPTNSTIRAISTCQVSAVAFLAIAKPWTREPIGDVDPMLEYENVLTD